MPDFTNATLQALANLRSPLYFQWYLVPILVMVFYIYFNEISRKNYNVVLAGLAFYGLEFFIEMLNGLWLHFSQHSALWTAPGDSAYLITVGLNIEICLMFAFMGVVFAKVLPADKNKKILGINNRIFYALFNSVLCVAIEIVLNLWGALVWEYWYWNWYCPFLIIIIGYSLYMFFSFWVHDMPSRKKQITVVAAMWALDVIGYGLFMGVLGWI
ncbi:MAG: hypothetical protein P9M14_18280 [Candidatus Alcyoniella australis]|nr:hypothetical protein [Candidatus Alcyoniella australis]